jgi:hypothetical protein
MSSLLVFIPGIDRLSADDLLDLTLKQATVGPCNTPKPSAWRPVEQSKWKRLDWVLCFAHTYLRLTFMHLSLVLLFLFLRL